MINRIPNYSWDSTVFIAWLDGEEAAPLNHIAAIVDEIEKEVANLIVSVVAYSEVLDVKRTKKQMEQFRQFLTRSNILTVETTIAIAEKVAAIRSKAIKAGRKLKTPDATFAAVAIMHNADVLHSLDPDLLNLDGNKIVDGLAITLPQTRSGQGLFPFHANEPEQPPEPPL